MVKRYLSCAVWLLLAAASLAGDWSFVSASDEIERLIDAYDKINDYIVDKDPKGDPESNVETAIKWMKNPTSNFLNKMKVLGVPEIVPIWALNDLIGLKSIKTDAGRCNRESHGILFRNDQATEFRSHKQVGRLGRQQRIDKVVRYYALFHAETCRLVYPKKFDRIYQTLDPMKKDRAEKFANELIAWHIFNHNQNLPDFEQNEDWFWTEEERQLFSDVVMKIDQIDGQAEAEIAFHAMKFFNQRLGQLLAQRMDKINGAIKDYLVDPCQHYVDKLGPEVFELAEYDNQVLEDADRYKPFDGQHGQYYYSWARYRICKLILNRDEATFRQSLMSIVSRN